MHTPNLPAIRPRRPAWNKGGIVGQKRPLLPKHVWAIHVRLGGRAVPIPETFYADFECRARMRSVPFSAIMITGALILPLVMVGMTDASQIDSASIP